MRALHGRLSGLVVGLLLAAVSAFAQAPPVGWPTGSTTAPVVLIPASAMNGAGVVSTAQVLARDGTACTAPSISFASSPTTGFYLTGGNVLTCIGGSNVGGFDATGVVINQTTLHWSDAYIRRSAAKTLTIDTDGAGGALTLVDIKSPVTSSSTITGATIVSGGNVQFGANNSVGPAGRTVLGSTADKLQQVLDNGFSTGAEFNIGTPTLGACTGGSMTSGSHNIAGEVTGNTSGSCIINFGTPNFTNTPFCFANDETTLTAVRISARSASSITVTGAVSGDAFQFFCIGRIGT